MTSEGEDGTFRIDVATAHDLNQLSMYNFVPKLPSATLKFNVQFVDNLIGLFLDPDLIELDGAGNVVSSSIELQRDSCFGKGKLERITKYEKSTTGEDIVVEDYYQYHLRNPIEFEAVVQLGADMSFQNAEKAINTLNALTGLNGFSHMNRRKVSSYIRIGCLLALQDLNVIMEDAWTYSLALDMATYGSTHYLDVRVRLYGGGGIQNLHLVAVPVHERRTSENMFKVLERVLDQVSLSWRKKLLSVTTDGENKMTGRHQGFVTLIALACEFPIMRVWCGAHQLDLVMKKAFRKLGKSDEESYDAGDEYESPNNDTTTRATAIQVDAEDEYAHDNDDDEPEYRSALEKEQEGSFFMKSLRKLATHIRNCGAFVRKHGKCPEIGNTRWLSLGMVTLWIRGKARVIQEHLEAKANEAKKKKKAKPDFIPDPKFWIYLFVSSEVAKHANVTFTKLQEKTLVVTSQRAACNALLEKICTKLGPKKIDDGREFASFELDVDELKTRLNTSFAFLELRMRQDMQADEVDTVLENCRDFIIEVLEGISDVAGVRDSRNQPAGDTYCEVMPYPIISTNREANTPFTRVIHAQAKRIAATRGTALTDYIDQDLDALVDKCDLEEDFLTRLEENHNPHSFEESWPPSLRKEFPSLYVFCCGLATTFPGTATVEADFSMVGQKKGKNRSMLSDISLEGILHGRQRIF